MRRTKKIIPIVAAAVAGSLLTIGVSMAFQLYAFQSDFKKASDVYESLLTRYLKPLSSEPLIEGAIQGMLRSLDDPYSEYIGPADTGEFTEHTLGEIQGIGVDIRLIDGEVVVVSPVRGAPAEQAGILPGDILEEVDGKPLAGLTIDDAASRIRGPAASEVTLLVRRSGIEHAFPVTIERGTIPTETVTMEELPGDIVHLRVSDFGVSTGEEFAALARTDAVASAKGIVLDLRQNPGGAVNAAADIAGFFVPAGQTITTMVDREGREEKLMAAGTPFDLPAVVLIDEGSASSSEIVALALRDNAGIPLVGERTFGKGIIQEAHFLRDGSVLTYTTHEMVSPAGTRHHGVGVEPDIAAARPAYTKLPVLSGKEPFSAGDSNPEIGYAQQYLLALGYDPGRDDGVFDEATAAAVKRLQQEAGLNANGQLDRVTIVELVDRLRALSRSDDSQLAVALAALEQQITAKKNAAAGTSLTDGKE